MRSPNSLRNVVPAAYSKEERMSVIFLNYFPIFNTDSASSNSGLENERQSPLLRLPTNIRNRIYKYATESCWVHISYVVRGETLTPGDCWGVPQPSYFQRVYHPDQLGGYYYTFRLDPRFPLGHRLGNPEPNRLPLVCGQLYKETVLLPYERNVWLFEDAHVFRQFVEKDRKWPVAQRRAVRTVMTASELYVKDLWKKLFLRLETVIVRGQKGELTYVDPRLKKETTAGTVKGKGKATKNSFGKAKGSRKKKSERVELKEGE
ncbi:hypothetical protein BU16DRAFT_285566 [Lophium mytilinum]|uniref:Uncharacterized protein n=1 Tax=Lophium mytilinum TaxID=390894 RepID=A0A6A6R7Z7_9PEZI|nr:hypothetical protein BU16DRAFT_285566 [Lophium mytilinum]